MKSHKAVSKRFKVTKKGKILKRKAGQNHFNGREDGTTVRNKRRDIQVTGANVKTLKQLVQSSK